MGAVKVAATRTTVPSTAITTSGNSGAQIPPLGAASMVIVANVSAYTSGTITYEIQWSFDGVNFFSSDPKDTFSNLSGAAQVFKYVQVKAPFYRVTWTSASFTHTLSDIPITYSISSPTGYEQGAPCLAAPAIGTIGSTTLAAVYVQGTPATMSAITAAPVGAGRIAIKVNCTANNFTASPQLEVLWSLTGVAGSTWHADPADTFVTFTGASTIIKEVPVKAPFFAIAMTVGTPGSATFTADVVATAL